MDLLYPFMIFALSIFIFLFCFLQMYFKSRFYKKYIFLCFFNCLFSGVLFAFYNNFLEQFSWFKDGFGYYAIFQIAVFFMALLKFYSISFQAHNYYNLITNSIKQTKWNLYLMLDKRDKIKDISDNFLEELGVEFKDVKNRNFFNIVEKTIRLKTYNGVEINNKEFREYYKNYRKEALNKSNGEKREIVFQNFQGNQVICLLHETPFFNFSKYKGRILVGEKKNDFSMLNVEKELFDLKISHNELINRFRVFLDITDEGMFFIDTKNDYVYGNDKFKEILSIENNVLSIDDLLKKSHPMHEISFRDRLRDLTKETPRSNLTIQFSRKNAYFVAELKLERIFDEEQDGDIICTIKDIDSRSFSKTGNTELDDLKTEQDITLDAQKVVASKRPFLFVVLRLINIPEINDSYSRAVGNYFLNEYIKMLKRSFAGETSNIYRLGGIDFALMITELTKIELFRRLVVTEHNSLEKVLVMGTISEKIRIRLGILTDKDADNAEEFLQRGKVSLNMACKTDYRNYYCFYDDIR